MRALAGLAGERLGRGLGASLEFQDFRDYAPGDDLRRVDWRSYARTDRLQVRLYREEVSPALDLVADLSASMGVTETKARATRDLVEAFAAWGLRAGGRPRRLRAGGARFEDAGAERLEGDGRGGLLPREALRPHGVRAVVSDFLFAGDPGPAIRRLAAGAAHLDVIQLLDPWEQDPALDGTWALVDAEDGSRQELRLDARAVKGYRERLARLRGAVESAARAAGARYACVAAAEPEAMFRGALLARGILEPAR